MAKVLVSVGDRLLSRIDRAAKSRGLSRSAYLAHLAERDLIRGKAPERRRALAKLDELFAQSPSGDSTDLVRAARDAR